MQQRHTPPEQQPEGDDQDLLTPDLPKEMKPIQTKPRQVGVRPNRTAAGSLPCRGTKKTLREFSRVFETKSATN